MAQLVVTAGLVEGRSKSEVARTYGLPRRWVITPVQRYEAERDAGLEPRSRRPIGRPREAHVPGRVDLAGHRSRCRGQP
jgi:transposase